MVGASRGLDHASQIRKSRKLRGCRRSPFPYRIELMASGERLVERVLGRAANAQLANAIFKGALAEHPDRHIALRRGTRLIGEAANKAELHDAWDR